MRAFFSFIKFKYDFLLLLAVKPKSVSRLHKNIQVQTARPIQNTLTTMNIQSIQEQTNQLISLNNSGTCYHMACRFDEAIGVFRQTLKSTQALLQDEHMSSLAENDVCPRSSDSPRVKMTFLHPTSNPPDFCSQDACIFVFQGAILIEGIESSTNNHPSLFAVLSSIALVAMYNIGVSCHLSGLGRSCTIRLKRAIQYYQSAYKLQMQPSIREACTSLLPAMSILNNVGTIYHLLNDPSESQKFMRHLLTAITWYRETQDRSTPRTCTENSRSVQHSLNGFWGNVACLILRDLHVAAAA